MIDETTIEAVARAIRARKCGHQVGWEFEVDDAIAATTALQTLSPGSTGETEGWRDIASAPIDGRRFLACWAGRTNNMMIVYYEDWTFHAQIGGWQSVVVDEPPTHWRPLPAPPSAMTSPEALKGEE